MERRARDASTHVDTTPDFNSTDDAVLLPYVWSYGMGAESTAAIHRMLTDPEARPDTIAPDFSNLLIVIAQTGDEWSTTGDLVEQHILPLLRKHNIRLVEVARNGPTKKDGITVLQDTRQPRHLHLDGVFKLSDENRATGTMPQLGGVRKCSARKLRAHHKTPGAPTNSATGSTSTRSGSTETSTPGSSATRRTRWAADASPPTRSTSGGGRDRTASTI